MKPSFLSLFLALFLTLALSASADNSGKDQRKLKTLVDYKMELSLSDTQVDEIKKALKSFHTTTTEQRKLLSQYEAEYSKLVSERAPLEQVKQKLRQVTDTNFNLRYADVLTSRKVESTLSAEQLTKWRGIQSKVRGGSR